jgi:hypothetical protein
LNSIVRVPSVRGCDTSFHLPRRIIRSFASNTMSRYCSLIANVRYPRRGP